MKDCAPIVEKFRELMLEAENHIWNNPETGFKEFQTSKYMEEKFEAMGYELTRAGNIPGFYTVVDTGKPGPTVLVLAEMDSVICESHPNANKKTGAVHACGHHAQCAAMLGVAGALKDPIVLDKLCGRIKLCLVPAEELLELEYRSELAKKGIIKFYGGKPEFLARGYFDDCDLAFMVHVGGEEFFFLNGGSIGNVAKKIIYKGVASHAGSSPSKGANALYAATTGLAAANAVRETFTEPEMIRWHPIMTEGGQMVNAIPDKVVLEGQIRGKTFEAIEKANKKINRALTGAALSLGCNIEIIDTPGYAPHKNDLNFMKLSEKAAERAIPHRTYYTGLGYSAGSSDMGDLSCVMPIIHPYSCRYVGKGHGKDYQIVDHEGATVDSAKFQIGLLLCLLENDAEEAKKIIEKFEPRFASIKEYIDYLTSIGTSGDRITYSDDEAKVTL